MLDLRFLFGIFWHVRFFEHVPVDWVSNCSYRHVSVSSSGCYPLSLLRLRKKIWMPTVALHLFIRIRSSFRFREAFFRFLMLILRVFLSSWWNLLCCSVYVFIPFRKNVIWILRKVGIRVRRVRNLIPFFSLSLSNPWALIVQLQKLKTSSTSSSNWSLFCGTTSSQLVSFDKSMSRVILMY